MFRRVLFLAAACVVAISAMAQKQQVMLDKVVAVVGNSSILHSEVLDQAEQLKARRLEQGYTSDRDPFNEALETLLTQKLLYHQALIDSVEVNTTGVAMQVEEHVKGMVENEGSVTKLEQKFNMPIFNIRSMLRRTYTEQSYADAMQSEVVGNITVTPGEVDQYYRQLDRDSLPLIADQYVYAQITREPSTVVEAKQRAKERLIDMRERIINGSAKFETLAMLYSEDGTAFRGGEMEPSPLSSLDAQFGEALKQLRNQQVSEVVETQFGMHIIQLLDKKGELYHFRHIIVRPSFTADELAEPVKFLDSLAAKIHADSITFEQAAMQHSADSHSKRNGGIVSNHDILTRMGAFDAKYTQTKFLKEDFGKMGHQKGIDDYYALSKLKVGEFSDAFSTEDASGNKFAKIVKLVEVIPTHVASIEEDYLRIEQMAKIKKQETTFNNWLSDKIKGMYVFIEPEYRDGDFENKNWVK